MKLVIDFILACFAVFMICFVLATGARESDIAKEATTSYVVKSEQTAKEMLNFDLYKVEGQVLTGSDALNAITLWEEYLPVEVRLKTGTWTYSRSIPFTENKVGTSSYVVPDSVFVAVIEHNANEIETKVVLMEDEAVVPSSSVREVAFDLNRMARVGIVSDNNSNRVCYQSTKSVDRETLASLVVSAQYKVKIYIGQNGLLAGVGFHGNNSTSFSTEFGGV